MPPILNRITRGQDLLLILVLTACPLGPMEYISDLRLYANIRLSNNDIDWGKGGALMSSCGMGVKIENYNFCHIVKDIIGLGFMEGIELMREPKGYLWGSADYDIWGLALNLGPTVAVRIGDIAFIEALMALEAGAKVYDCDTPYMGHEVHKGFVYGLEGGLNLGLLPKAKLNPIVGVRYNKTYIHFGNFHMKIDTYKGLIGLRLGLY